MLDVSSGWYDIRRWLVAAQSRGGGWEAAEPAPAGAGPTVPGEQRPYDEATCYASLALAEDLLFLGEDETTVRALRAAVGYLIRPTPPAVTLSRPEDRGWGSDLRSHEAIRALALSSSYRVVGEASWRPHLERSAGWLRRQLEAGARQTGCQCEACVCFRESLTILAARSLAHAGVPMLLEAVPASARKVSDSLRTLLAGHARDPVLDPTECATGPTIQVGIAAGVLALQISGSAEDPAAVGVSVGLSFLNGHLPRWDIDEGTIDYRYFMFGTMAMERAGPPHWMRWRETVSWILPAYADHFGPHPYPLADRWSQGVGPAGPAAVMELLDLYTQGVPYRFLAP